MSTARIARTLGVSEPTVRKRIDRLRDAGVLRVMGLLDPAATGFPVYAVICVQVQPGVLKEVGRRFAQLDRVAMVQYTTGRFDIFVEAMLESNRALYDFLGDEVAAIDGIAAAETFHVLAIDKFNYMWALPDEGVDTAYLRHHGSSAAAPSAAYGNPPGSESRERDGKGKSR